MAQISNENAGQTVRYYKNGWRLGLLLRVDRDTAFIKNPIKKKRDIKILASECELYLEARPMPSIFEELFKAASTVGLKKQGADQSDDEYLTTLATVVNRTLPLEHWQTLSLPAQKWNNEAINYINKFQPVPLCPGFIGMEAVNHTEATVIPPKGLTADEIFKSKPPLGSAASRFQITKSLPKVKATGIMDALRRTVIIHPEWTSRQVYDYLKLNGFPNAKLDTISVDGGNIRRVIEIAKELDLWHDKKETKEEIKEEAKAIS